MDLKRSATRAAARLVAAVVGLTAFAAVAAPPKAGDWPMYGRDYAGTRFSPLTRDRYAANVATLDKRGRCRSRATPARTKTRRAPAGNPQATPIVVGGVMYLPVRGNEVLALERTTGRELWRTDLASAARHHGARRRVLARRRRSPPRILLTAGPTLVALDAGTGAARRRASAATASSRSPCRGTACRRSTRTSRSSAPRRARPQLAEPGDTRAFDVRTGDASVGLSHRAAARRARSRHLARQRLAQSLRRQRLGLVR